MSESKFDAIHGFVGRVLYHELQHSTYGLYRNFWGYYGPGGLVPLGFICSLMILSALLLDGWRHGRHLPCQVHEDMCLAMLASFLIDGILLTIWLYSLLLNSGAVRNKHWPQWARSRTWGPPKFLEGCWFCRAAVLLVPTIWAFYWSLRHF